MSKSHENKVAGLQVSCREIVMLASQLERALTVANNKAWNGKVLQSLIEAQAQLALLDIREVLEGIDRDIARLHKPPDV